MGFIQNHIWGLLWCCITIALSTMRPSSIPEVGLESIWQIDKLAHFGMYFIMFILLAKGNSLDDNRFSNKELLLFCAIFGIVMELLQYGIYTGRNFELLDIIANIIGSIIGAVFYSKFFKSN